MNKTTFKGLMALLCVFAMLNTYAQQKQSQLSEVKTLGTQTQVAATSMPLQLTAESQRSLQETGYVKCASVEMHQRRVQRTPGMHTEQDFENWLAPLMDAKRKEIAAQKANGTFKKMIINVPIIFHVITDGSQPTNLSAALINAQIDQLNLDLANQGGVGGASSTHPAAADAEIVFVPAAIDPLGNVMPEPGINRVTTFGAGPFDTNDFDVADGNLMIKSTNWDYNLYANVWTADITGGILGYAQFPSNSTLPGMNANGGQSADSGVVCGYGTIGSRDLPGSAAPYNLGRTLTHEIGHWIGLRHIWGDTAQCTGGATAGDYCADTPDSTSANYGCPGGTDKCTSDGLGPDMIENYMDYSDDACMDIFTADQVLRIATVFANADGLSNLPNSPTGNASPVISFSASTGSVIEGSDCAFTDVNIPITVNVGASASATANFSITGGSAANGIDYSLITPNITFATGATAAQDFTLRIFHDGFVEGDEVVNVDFTITTSGDAVAGLNTLAFTIVEDDELPVNVKDINLLSWDFESAHPWSEHDADGDTNTWLDGISGVTYTGITGGFAVSESNGGPLNTGNNFKPDNYFYNTNALVIPSGATNVNFSFGIGGFQDNEPYYVYWATDATSPATILSTGTAINPNQPNKDTTLNGDGQIMSIDVTNIAGQSGYLVIRHESTGNGPNGSSGLLLLDNLVVTATVPTEVQTAVNTGVTNDQTDLFQTGTVYTSDSATSNVMLDIANNTSFDYGCTDVSVSRAGTTAQAYNGSSAPNLVMDKVFSITPTSTTSGGNNAVTFYFEEAEIAGWETATGLSRTVLEASREGSSDIVPLTIGAFGSEVTLTGTFTGLTGDYYFGPNAAFVAAGNILVSPVVYLSGAALNSGNNRMRDDLRVAGLIPTTSPYDGTTCNASVFNVSNGNAIVDWVWVELRDQTNSAIVVEGKSALLQADGDIVDVDGTSALGFAQAADRYFIAVDHRNHLAIMSDTAILLGTSTTGVDFSDSGNPIAIGTEAQTSTGMPAGVVAMWAGDTNADGSVSYQGAGNDTNTVKDNVIAQPANTAASNLYSFSAYDVADVNMDGNISYQGAGNDSNVIKDNILAHSGNTTGSNLFSFVKQF